MVDPPKTPPPFRGRTARLPQTPVSPFKFDASLSKAIPAGNFLIIRGVLERGAKKIDPVPVVELKVAEIRTSNSLVRDIPVVVTPFSTRDVSTSCYLRLSPSLVSPEPKAEPRTDLLHLWIAPLTALGWEVKWAPQIEGKDKRMWARVADVFDEALVETADARKKYDKVITRIRAQFDSLGLQTVNGFRSGNGAIITFAFPAGVETAVNDRSLLFDSKSLPIYRVRQIEIGYAFEIVIGGITGIDPTALNNVVGWFADFERDGQSLLAEWRIAQGERDHLIVSMKDWASTADVLTSTDRFRKELADYDLRAPQLLFRLNTSAAWKADPSAVITEGAEKVTGAVAALTRRIETNERDARARDADTKTRLTAIDSTINAVSSLTSSLANRQEELVRGFFILQQDTQYTAALGRLDASIMANRQTFMRPLDDAEKSWARTEIQRQTEERKLIQTKLDALHGNPANLVIDAGPTISPPPPPTLSPISPPPPSAPSPASPWP